MISEFQKLNLTHLEGFLSEMKFQGPTQVQKKIIPKILQGENFLVAAPTGSGKTLTFAMPLVQMFKDTEKQLGEGSSAPYAIVLAPTRELAIQIQGIFKSLSHHSKIRTRLLVGGVKSKGTKDSLRGSIDFLITVPGRFLSCLKKGEIKLDRLQHLVFDEADQFFELGFKKEIEQIWEQTKENSLQLSLFSATKPDKLEAQILSIFKNVPFNSYDVGGKNLVTREIETFNILLHEGEKPLMLKEILKERLRGTGIIFTNKKDTVELIQNEIIQQSKNKRIHILHGGMQTRERNKNFKAFVKEKGILISTDVAARGIDIKEVSWVLNYDLPVWAVYYIHRCGRTGRSGTKGMVVNFVTPKESHLIEGINQAIQKQSALKLDLLRKKPGKQKKANKKSPGKKSAKNSRKVSKKSARKPLRSKRR